MAITHVQNSKETKGFIILFSEIKINGAQIDDKTAIGINEKNLVVVLFKIIFSE